MRRYSIGIAVLIPVLLFGVGCQSGNGTANNRSNNGTTRITGNATDTGAASNSSLPDRGGSESRNPPPETKPVTTIHSLSSADAQGTSATNTSGPAAYQDKNATTKGGNGGTEAGGYNRSDTNQAAVGASNPGVNGTQSGMSEPVEGTGSGSGSGSRASSTSTGSGTSLRTVTGARTP